MTIKPLPPDLAGRDWTLYQPDPLGRLGRGTWGRRPEAASEDDDPDPEVNRLRRAWQRNGYFTDAEILLLDNGVGRGQPNNRADVARIEAALHRAGHYDVGDTNGPTGYFGPPQEEAIKHFQDASGVTVDGWLGRDGETVQALAAAQPAADINAAKRGPSLLDHGDDGYVQEARMSQQEMNRNPADSWLSGGGAGGIKAPPARPLAVPPLLPSSPREIEPPARPLNKVDANTPASRALPAHDPDALRQAQPELRVSPALPPRYPGQPRVLPPSSEDGGEKRTVGDYLANGIAEEMIHHWGPWGNPTTRRGNDIAVEQCLDVAKTEFVIGYNAKHIGGASQDGEGERRLTESHIPIKDTGSFRNSDGTLMITRPDGGAAAHHFNTAATYVDGRLKPHEQQALDDIKRELGERMAQAMPKLKPGQDEREYAKMAREMCRDLLQDYLRPEYRR